MIDDLPSATAYKSHFNLTTVKEQEQYEIIRYDYGIPVVHKNIKAHGPFSNEIIVNNHLVMTVNTHTTNSGAIRIVGFEVEAFSVNWGD